MLALIRDRKPRTIAELADMSGRAAPNLTRTLEKLEAVGFVAMRSVASDPFSRNDRVEMV